MAWFRRQIQAIREVVSFNQSSNGSVAVLRPVALVFLLAASELYKILREARAWSSLDSV
jgi:hypothetical protein